MNNTQIAVIDSGINPAHPHVGAVSGGHGYELDPKGLVVKHPDFIDEIGHGTAISGIIQHQAPWADLYAVKIFKQELGASLSLLASALKWCIERQFSIIHLSLGVEDPALAHLLEALCKSARDNNILVIASARGPGHLIYPACFNTVVGVYWHHGCTENQLVFHPHAKVQFGAHGYPRPIPGLPRERNFKGHSFAAAHVTARAARLLKQHPGKDPAWIQKQLENYATTHLPALAD